MSKQGAKAFKANYRTARANKEFTKAYADGRQKSSSWRRYIAKLYATETKLEKRSVKQAIREFLQGRSRNSSPKKIPFGKKII